MWDENKSLINICILVSLAGLVLVYYSSRGIEAKSIGINEISYDMVGRKVVTTGFVIYRYNHQDGHIFVTIEDESGENIQVPLFSGFVSSYEKMNSQNAKLDEIHPGSLIEIEGIVGEYKNQLQIVPRKPDDLRILYD